MKRSAVMNSTLRSGWRSRTRHAIALSRCVLPRPAAEWMNNGLKLTGRPGCESEIGCARGRAGEGRPASDEASERLARIEWRAALRHGLAEHCNRLHHCPACTLGLIVAHDTPLGDVLRALRHASRADLDMHIVEM